MLGKTIFDNCKECDCGEKRLIVNKKYYLCDHKNKVRLGTNDKEEKQRGLLITKTTFKRSKKRLKLSKKKVQKNNSYKRVCQQIAEERVHQCTGCKTANNLTHSHIISRSRNNTYIDKSWNITYHCISCHDKWESRNIIQMMLLDDFVINMKIVEEKDNDWYNLLLSKLTNLGCVVYKIEINNKIYIGSSVNFRKRFLRHLKELSKNKHHNAKIQNLYNKYGLKSLKFQILEYNIDQQLQFQKEQYWIDELQPVLNIKKVVETDGRVNKDSWSNRVDKQIFAFDNEGELVESFSSISDAVRWLNKGYVTAISEAASGKRKSAYGYFWRYEPNFQFRQTETSSWIIQLTLTGEYVKRWNSLKEINEELKINISDISGVCNGRLNSAGGYCWRKYNDKWKDI